MNIRRALDWLCREPKPLVISVAVLCFLAGASFHASGSFSSPACRALLSPDGDCDWGHWLYRWQSLVGAGVALFAAMIAVQPVFRQMTETQRQSAAAGSLTIRKIVEELEDELGALHQHTPDVLILVRNLKYTRGRLSLTQLTMARAALKALEAAIVPHYRHHPINTRDVETDLTILRRDLVTRSKAMEMILGKLGDAQVINARSLPRDEEALDFNAVRLVATEWAEGWDEHVESYRKALERTIRNYWVRARELERQAIGTEQNNSPI